MNEQISILENDWLHLWSQIYSWYSNKSEQDDCHKSVLLSLQLFLYFGVIYARSLLMRQSGTSIFGSVWL